MRFMNFNQQPLHHYGGVLSILLGLAAITTGTSSPAYTHAGTPFAGLGVHEVSPSLNSEGARSSTQVQDTAPTLIEKDDTNLVGSGQLTGDVKVTAEVGYDFLRNTSPFDVLVALTITPGSSAVVELQVGKESRMVDGRKLSSAFVVWRIRSGESMSMNKAAGGASMSWRLISAVLIGSMDFGTNVLENTPIKGTVSGPEGIDVLRQVSALSGVFLMGVDPLGKMLSVECDGSKLAFDGRGITRGVLIAGIKGTGNVAMINGPASWTVPSLVYSTGRP